MRWKRKEQKETKYKCPQNWMFERIGVWTNTGRPFKQAAGSSWPFCVSKAAGRCQHLMAVWLLWVFSLATGRRRLLKYPTRPAFSFVLPSFPICCLLSLAAFRVSSSSAAEPFSFGSGAAPPLRCACGKVSHIDLSGLLFPCDSGTVRFSLSPFFRYLLYIPPVSHRFLAILSPYRHLNGWGLVLVSQWKETISYLLVARKQDKEHLLRRGPRSGTFSVFFFSYVICMPVWPLGPI